MNSKLFGGVRAVLSGKGFHEGSVDRGIVPTLRFWVKANP